MCLSIRENLANINVFIFHSSVLRCPPHSKNKEWREIIVYKSPDKRHLIKAIPLLNIPRKRVRVEGNKGRKNTASLILGNFIKTESRLILNATAAEGLLNKTFFLEMSTA